jgi:DNA-binding response OmpR family regulator
MLILLIDDDPEDQEVFCDAVNEVDESIKCLTAKDSKQAMDMLTNELIVLPDCIFLDYNMPIVNGRQLLISLKTTARLKDIPVIIYSTGISPNDEVELKKIGASEIFVKPPRFNDLVSKIRDVLT